MANIDIFYKDGSYKGSMDRDEAYRTGEWNRVSWIFPCNDRGEILLELRSKEKAVYPRTWAPPTETLRGETNKQCAVRGLQEELRMAINPNELVDLGLEFNVNMAITSRYNINHIQHVFGLRWNGDISDLTIDKREVEEVRLFPHKSLGKAPLFMPIEPTRLKQVFTELRRNRLLPAGLHFLGLYL
ncbi:hypothetical protein AUJ84_02955 [Candidatus Pacearchaeota archaeon CG1_02_32_132]|nr:MAG: hypothetical protein AUJ84_02955 [Candidatus Pacearchaeota archaeon CG1_02_32_132]